MTEPEQERFDQRPRGQFPHAEQMNELYSHRNSLGVPQGTYQSTVNEHMQAQCPTVFPMSEHFNQRPLFNAQEPINSVQYGQREEDTAAQFIPPPDNDSTNFVQNPSENYSTQQIAFTQAQTAHINVGSTDSLSGNKDQIVDTDASCDKNSHSPAVFSINVNASDKYDVVRVTENPESPPAEELGATAANGIGFGDSIQEDNTQSIPKEEDDAAPMDGATVAGNDTGYHITRRRLVSNLRPAQTETESEPTSVKVYNEEEKLRIIHQAKIYGIEKAAEKYNIPKNTIVLWKKTVNRGRPLRGRGRPKGTAPRKVIMDRAVQVRFEGEKSLADILAEGGVDREVNVADSVEVFPNDCAIKVRRRRTTRKKKPMTYNTDDYFNSQMEEHGNILADFAEIVASESFIPGVDDGGIEEDDEDDEEVPKRRRGRLRKRFSAAEKQTILEFSQSNSLRTTAKKFKVPFSTIIRWKEVAKNQGELMGEEINNELGDEPRPKKRRGNIPNVPRGPYKKYTLEEKKEVVDYTQKHSLRKAAEKFQMPVSTVMAWKREINGPDVARSEKTGRKIGSGRLISYSPEIDGQIVNWVMSKKETNTHVGIRDICQHAQELVRTDNPNSNFKASHGWVTKFLKRHSIKLEKCRKRRPHPQGECGKNLGSAAIPRKPRQPKREQAPQAMLPMPDMRREMTMNQDRGPSVERHQTPPTLQYGQYGEIPSQVPVFSHNYMYGLSPLPPPAATHSAHIAPSTDSLHNHPQTPGLQYNSWIQSGQSNTLTYSTHTAPTHQPPQPYWSDFPRADYHPQQ